MHDLDDLAADLRERLLADPGDGELIERIRALVDREAAVLDAGARADLAGRIAERAFGLGPLEPLLRDEAVDEVMVCGCDAVWVERAGVLEQTTVRFAHEHELRDAIERILAPLGRRVDEAEPLCDARLPDGSRVNVVLPPLALDGPVLTIRRFRARGFSADDLRRSRRGDDPPARPQRAADAPGPHRRRRGPRRRGARHADRADHRARRLALDDPRRRRG